MKPQTTYLASLIMEYQQFLLMPVVATTLLLTLAILAIFLSMHFCIWGFQASADLNHQSPSKVRSSDTSACEVSKDLDIPEGWFTDAKVFSLERRAIFATVCICLIASESRPNDGRHGYALLTSLTFNVLGTI